MRQNLQWISLGLVGLFLLGAFGFEWQNNTSFYGLFIGLLLIAGAVLYIASDYNNRD